MKWLIFFLMPVISFGEVCQNRDQAKLVSKLPKALSESSGLALSRINANRIYHIADGPVKHFHFSNKRGENIRKIRMGHSFRYFNFFNFDVEDLATAPCFDSISQCLFVGDFGDNKRFRPWIKISIFKEREKFKPGVAPNRVIRARYPGLHQQDVEAMAVHPITREIYLVTKNKNGISRIFKLVEKQWRPRGLAIRRLIPVGKINLPGESVTSLDIAFDGKSFALLTYSGIYEFGHDLSSSDDIEEDKSTFIPLEGFAQLEALAYVPGTRHLYFTSEKGRADHTPLMRINCLEDFPWRN